jgi:hypothetical protein
VTYSLLLLYLKVNLNIINKIRLNSEMEAQKKERNSSETQLPKFKCDILGCEKVFNTKFVLKRHY